jgi:hypothetical protein
LRSTISVVHVAEVAKCGAGVVPVWPRREGRLGSGPTTRSAESERVAAKVADDPLAAFAHDQAAKNLTDQAAVLEALRGRAGTLLSTAALATSFLGGLTLVAPAITEAGAFRGARIGDWAWAAIVAFGVVAVLTFLILWPWTWTFSMNPMSSVQDATSAGLDLDGLKWDLALYQQASGSRTTTSSNGCFEHFS